MLVYVVYKRKYQKEIDASLTQQHNKTVEEKREEKEKWKEKKKDKTLNNIYTKK